MQALEDGLQKVVGAHILKTWGMPTIICESHQYLHDYRSAPHAMEQASIVNAATRFAQHMLAPQQLTLEELLNSEVFEDLNLYQDDIQILLEKNEQVKSSMEAMSAT
jgi:HD-like signal output (HDOD) protein